MGEARCTTYVSPLVHSRTRKCLDEHGVWQDLGNTNFSIHLPRASFDRHATAQVVMKAVRAMGVDANVNDRNDICVGKEKICALLPTARAAKLTNMFLRLRLRVQDCEGQSVSPRYNAHIYAIRYPWRASAVQQGTCGPKPVLCLHLTQEQ